MPADLIISIAGTELTSAEREQLEHPAICGLILFKKNFKNRKQVAELIAEIKNSSVTELEISVDQEGGRVQRFSNGFSNLPALATYGEQWHEQPAQALDAAYAHGLTTGRQCSAVGVSVVYSPVVDLDWGLSEVIGNRAFHRDPEVVGQLAKAMMLGLHDGGVVAVAKHFPGHGGVAADSHTEGAVDQRGLAALQEDMAPYPVLIEAGLKAVMMAHVQFPRIDPLEAGYSNFWVNQLKKKLGFSGDIYCDDLSMVGAHSAGSLIDRVMLTREAGCNRLLLCNFSVEEKAGLLAELY
ncbi:MAG: beta-N-acetylhexosaminidase [Gammaproteobacteria bacterium]|nr:MAG: beta-N-acetylhexosaminidase [Gammaproteobacteria bacterium]